jgi:hypothetical protein
MSHESEQEPKSAPRISAVTVKSVLGGMKRAALDLGPALGRDDLTHGPLLEAIAVWYLKQPEVEQLRIARLGLLGAARLKEPGVERALKDLRLDEIGDVDKRYAFTKEANFENRSKKGK